MKDLELEDKKTSDAPYMVIVQLFWTSDNPEIKTSISKTGGVLIGEQTTALDLMVVMHQT